MNWGKGIIIVAAAFMAFILALSFFMINQTPELEEKDYYEKDLAYQQVITARTNAETLEKPVQVTYQASRQMVQVEIPLPQFSEGIVAFSRPAAARQDFTIRLTPNQPHQTIPVSHLSNGLWRVQVSWQSDGKSYQSHTWEIIK